MVKTAAMIWGQYRAEKRDELVSMAKDIAAQNPGLAYKYMKEASTLVRGNNNKELKRKLAKMAETYKSMAAAKKKERGWLKSKSFGMCLL